MYICICKNIADKSITFTFSQNLIKLELLIIYYNNTNIAPPCPAKRQELLARKLIQFIIHFVLPLYILQNQSFREFIHACEPGFRIPCVKTAKNLIHEAYNWCYDQLSSLLRSSITSVHLTTDLWTAKLCYGYLEVTAM